MNNDTTENSNKLIKDFLGKENELCRSLSAPQFHKSWDWIMPVIKKIRGIVNEELTIDEFDNNRYLENRLSPYNYDIKSINKAVVEFIKWYNLNKSR